jgi:hypothetical protein
MKPEAQNLRERVDRLQNELTGAKRKLTGAERELDAMERTCQHQYGPVVYDPVHTKAYTIPGDPPGTMGIDRQLPCHVPASTEERWKRECELCGKVEYTTKTQPTGREPVFPKTGRR